MKAASLALALLGATALTSVALAQTPPASGQTPPVTTPSEAAPRATSPDAGNQTGTQAQSEWRDQMGRDAAPDTAAGQQPDNWRRAQNDEDARGGNWGRDDEDDSDDNDDDDDDDNVTLMQGPSKFGNRMASPSASRDDDRSSRHEGWRGDAPRMTPGLMRMHMRMMGQERGARLRLKRGDSSIDIACPTGEPIGPCVDAVVKLMDRLHAMPQNR